MTRFHYTITWTALAAVLFLPWLRFPARTVAVGAFPRPVRELRRSGPSTARRPHAAVLLYVQLTVVAIVGAASCEPEVVAWGMGIGGVVVVGLSAWAFEHTMWGSSYMTDFHIVFAGVGTNENVLAYTLAVSLAATLAIGRPRAAVPLLTWLAVLGVHAYGLVLGELRKPATSRPSASSSCRWSRSPGDSCAPCRSASWSGR